MPNFVKWVYHSILPNVHRAMCLVWPCADFQGYPFTCHFFSGKFILRHVFMTESWGSLNPFMWSMCARPSQLARSIEICIHSTFAGRGKSFRNMALGDPNCQEWFPHSVYSVLLHHHQVNYWKDSSEIHFKPCDSEISLERKFHDMYFQINNGAFVEDRFSPHISW